MLSMFCDQTIYCCIVMYQQPGNSKSEENADAQVLPSVIPDPETVAANQKPSTVPEQVDNLVILDQNGHPIQYERVVRKLHYDSSP